VGCLVKQESELRYVSGLAGREAGWKKEKKGVEGEGEETGVKRESALRDCWWVITPPVGESTYLPVGTE
jgi:hypothetical protein